MPDTADTQRRPTWWEPLCTVRAPEAVFPDVSATHPATARTAEPSACHLAIHLTRPGRREVPIGATVT